MTKVLIPKLRLFNNRKSISGSLTVYSAVINTASAIAAMAKQIKMYGADQPAEFVAAFPSDNAYKVKGRKITTEINPL